MWRGKWIVLPPMPRAETPVGPNNITDFLCLSRKAVVETIYSILKLFPVPEIKIERTDHPKAEKRILADSVRNQCAHIFSIV